MISDATKYVVSGFAKNNESRSSFNIENYEMSTGNQTLGRRLKEIRTVMGFSQKQLGIQAGLDQFVASSRINRYELAVHKADYLIVQRLADILNIPTAYFFTEEDDLAELMLIYFRASQRQKNLLLKAARAAPASKRGAVHARRLVSNSVK